jgi:rhodanese-related sulfurtransferase
MSPEELKRIRPTDDLILLDVRRQVDLEADGTAIPGAIRGDPELLDSWASSPPANKQIVVYCTRGGSVSRSVTPTLLARGLTAKYVAGGIAAWKDCGGEVVRIENSGKDK